jgi:hypothetical protein
VVGAIAGGTTGAMLARKPHNGRVITFHKAAAIIDIRPDNTFPSTLAFAIK